MYIQQKDIHRISSQVETLEDTKTISKIELGYEKLFLYKQAGLSDIEFFKRYFASSHLYEESFMNFHNCFDGKNISPEFFIDFFTHKILSHIKNVYKDDILSNITYVNKKQKRELLRKFCFGDKFTENVRNLVFYFRGQSMPEFEFQILYNALQLYIKSKKSQLFNKIIVLSRSSGNVPDFTHENYIDAEGREFQDLITLQSNAIHFTEGTLYENRKMGTTTHIAGTSVLERSNTYKNYNNKMGDNYVPLSLKFGGKKFQDKKIDDIESLISEVVTTVQVLERIMIEK